MGLKRFEIKNIILNNNGEDLKVTPKKINLIIGPNNSGKSRLLKELRDTLSGQSENNKIIKDVSYNLPGSVDELIESYNIRNRVFKDRYNTLYLKAFSNKSNQQYDVNMSFDNYYTRSFNSVPQDWEDWLRRNWNEIKNEDEKKAFFSWLGSMFFQYLGTEDRLTSINMQRKYGLQEGNTNFLTIIQSNSKTLNILSQYIKKIFNKDIFLDVYTLGSMLAFRVGNDFDFIRKTKIGESEITNSLVNYGLLDDEGDGIKSFISTFLTVYNQDNDVLLIDEPEAFLHPPLARQLGETIGEIAKENKQVFISTHSVELLKGIISSCNDINIIRIERPIEGMNKITKIESSTLKKIILDPLLRVSRVLEGLFCEKVVITESEADELFYQEMVEIIRPQSGIYFAHGQNKQTIPDIAKMYKEIGVKFVMVTDFDAIRVNDEFNRFLKVFDNGQLDNQTKQEYREICEKTRRKIEANSPDQTKDGKKAYRDKIYHQNGINYFENQEIYQEINEMIDDLRKKGLAILKKGELETSLNKFDLPYSNQKNKWIVKAIEKISTLTRDEIIEYDINLYNFINDIIEM